MRPVRVFVAADGNAFMHDIAGWLAEAVGLDGRTAEVVADGRLPDEGPSVDLVVAPHEFFPLGGWSDREVDAAVRSSIPVCTEQPGTPWFEISALYAERSPLALDINAHGVAALRSRGIDARHLRLGGVPSMDRRDRRNPSLDRSRDVLFLGGRTDRRAERLAELAPLLWNRTADIRLFTFARPVSRGTPGLAFGDEKFDLLADSRILVNIHRDEVRPGYFEWARMVEAMANGCCVLTEPSSGFEPLQRSVHFIESDDLYGSLAALLEQPERCREFGERAAQAVLEEYPLAASLRPVLADLDESRVLSTRRSLAPRYAARTRRLEQRPLLPAFQPTRALRRRLFHAYMAETELQRRIDRTRCLVRFGTDDHIERIESAGYADADPEVSVVVTLFGYAHVVRETLDAVVASRSIDVEIVVVDDHSLDDGRAVVRSWIDENPTVPTVLLGADANRGLPAARNLGFAHARADQVMVMDADNLVYPSALRRLSDALAADPDAWFAYSTLEEFGTATGVRSAMGWHVPWLCEGNYIDAQAMVRRSAWERLGGYRTDERMYGWEDWDFWLRVAVSGGHGIHVPQILGRYRTQQASMLAMTNLIAEEMLEDLKARYPGLPWAPWL